MLDRTYDKLWNHSIFSVTLGLGFLLVSITACLCWFVQGVPIEGGSPDSFLVRNKGKEWSVGRYEWWAAYAGLYLLLPGIFLLVLSPPGALVMYFLFPQQYEKRYRKSVMAVNAASLCVWVFIIVWTVFQVFSILYNQ